jgi:hypothetical protein
MENQEQELEFVQDEEKVESKPTNKRIPADYIPVKLSSLGKLTAPKVLHIKDYSGKDVLELSLSTKTSATFLRRLVQVIENVMFEGFDCRELHDYELEEIMLNLTGNFLASVIQNYPYPYEEEEYAQLDDARKENIEKGFEHLTVDIPIANIKTNPIASDFKEPISITNKTGLTVQFRLPRVGDYFIAEDYVDSKYLEEAQSYSHIDKIMLIENKDEQQIKLEALSQDELKAYEEYISARGIDYIIAKQAQLLVKYGAKTLETPADKIKYYDKVGVRFWKEYNKLCDDYLKFGVDHNIEMISPITKEKVTRRCQFRPVDFISTDDISESGDYAVLFG